MSTHVLGIKPPDDRWKAMKACYDACRAADVGVPVEVLRFFGNEPPDDRGVVVDLEAADGVHVYGADMAWGYEVELEKLSPDIKILRFYNSR